MKNIGAIRNVRTVIVEGDALQPTAGDVLAQLGTLDLGDPLPEGWSATTDNLFQSQVTRIGLRCDIEGDF